MSDPDGDTRPRVNRAELRRLREALSREDFPLTIPAAPPVPTSPRGTILTVCTGNICRSPMAEVLLHAALRDLRVHVRSAGTHALVEHGMTEQAQQLAVANGADAADAAAHRARRLDESMLQSADLVLTMAREHRSFAVQHAPAVLHRAFTVREFARLAETLTDAQVHAAAVAAGAEAGDRLRALARLVAAQRGVVPPAPEHDDVVDPYRRSMTTYELSASQLVPAVAEAGRVIRAALS
jgi:protein-tyrosine phosphatase